MSPLRGTQFIALMHFMTQGKVGFGVRRSVELAITEKNQNEAVIPAPYQPF
jgi:hypothetical protein